MLNRNEIIAGDNGFMVVAVQTLRTVTTVFLGFMCQIVRCESLPCQNISAMSLIAENLYNGT